MLRISAWVIQDRRFQVTGARLTEFAVVQNPVARQRYETPEDLAKEIQVMETVCHYWKCKAIKLNDRRFNIDFIAYRVTEGFGVVPDKERKNRIQNTAGGVYIEVRCRNNKKDDFPTMMLAEKKWIELKNYSTLQSPAIFLVSWRDCIGYVKYDDHLEVKREWGGRNQMRDNEDVEPMVHIPISSFKILTTI